MVSYKIWEVEIKPKDIVAVETFSGRKSIVTTKAKLVRIHKKRSN